MVAGGRHGRVDQRHADRHARRATADKRERRRYPARNNHDVLRELHLILKDRSVGLAIEPTVEGPFLLRARAHPNADASVKNLRISFQLERTMRHCDVLADSRDKRALGLAVNWIEVAL